MEERQKVMENKRKHRSQMEAAEIALIERAIHRRTHSEFAPHAFDRMREKRISFLEVSCALDCGELIEVHNNVRDDIRALVRHRQGASHVCVVISLISGKIITAYRNAANDNHATLNAALISGASILQPF
jgi:hypothetical protein